MFTLSSPPPRLPGSSSRVLLPRKGLPSRALGMVIRTILHFYITRLRLFAIRRCASKQLIFFERFMNCICFKVKDQTGDQPCIISYTVIIHPLEIEFTPTLEKVETLSHPKKRNTQKIIIETNFSVSKHIAFENIDYSTL